MFEITRSDPTTVRLSGRFDAAQVDAARGVLGAVDRSCTVDFTDLDYISSAGLGLLFATHKRLLEDGGRLRLANLKPHIRELFQIAGFDAIFEIG